MDGRFESLLERFQSGETTPEENAELDRILRAEPAKRRILVERLLLDVQLYKAFAGLAPVAKRPVLPFAFLWVAGTAAAAALLLVATAGLLVHFLGNPQMSECRVDAGQVRTGQGLVACIPSDEPFEVVGAQTAMVHLPDGSTAELDPATHAVIRAPADADRPVVKLIQGGGTFTVTHDKGRFRVETPLGTVDVLGTQFTVKLTSVAPNAKKAGAGAITAMAVSVLAGTVRVENNGQSYVLAAGANRVFPEPVDNQPVVAGPVVKVDKRPERIDGLLRAVDLAKHTITVMTTDKGEVIDQSFRLTPDVPVRRGGKTARLDDLKLGKQVRLRLADDRASVAEIEQELFGKDDPPLANKDTIVAKKDPDVAKKEPDGTKNNDPKKKGTDTIKGRLKKVDLAGNAITVTIVEDGKDVDVIYELQRDQELVINGKPGKLADLKLGIQLHLKLSDDGNMAIELKGTLSGPNNNDVNKQVGEEIHGLLKAVDPVKETITIIGKIKGTDTDLRFAVMKDTRIVLKGQAIKLADLIPGMQVHLRLSENRTTAVEIRVDGKKIK